MKKIYWFLFLFVSMVVSLFFDKAILDFLIRFRYELLNSFFIIISHWSIVFILVVIVSFVYFLKKWNSMLVFWTSVILSFLIATVLKLVFMRMRPDVLSLITETGYSFPSRHAAILFAFLPILFQDKKGIWVLVITIIISYSRIYL